MLFTIVIMQATMVEARVRISSMAGEDARTLAARARSELMENAMRMRAARTRQVMTEATLKRFADLFHDVVMGQAQSGASRSVTAYTRGGEEVFHSEGQIALLGKATDITCLIDAIDDERLARQTTWRDDVEAKLGRPPVAADIRFDDMSAQDMLDR